MRLFRIQRFSISALVCLILFSAAVSSQTFRFRNYGIENKLPSEVIYTLNQDLNGYLWVGTTEGLSKFDGFDFFRIQFPDSAAGRYPTVSLKDNNGVLWFGCNDGTLFYVKDRDLRQVPLPNASGTGISSLIEGPDGLIYVIPQRKPAFRVNPVKLQEVDSLLIESDPNMFSACFSGDGDLLIGTQENLMVCRVQKDSILISGLIEGFDYSRIMSVNRLGDGRRFIIGTDGSGLYNLILNNTGNVLSRFKGFPGHDALTVRSITVTTGNTAWISAPGTGVFQMQFSDNCDSLVSVRLLDQSSGLAGENASLVFNDAEGNIWIGFNGEGLSMLITDSFEFNAPGGDRNSNNIIFCGKYKDDYILGTPSGFYVYDLLSRKAKSFTPFSRLSGQHEISSYFIDNENNVWIGTKGGGLFVRNIAGTVTQFYRSGDSGSDYINDIKIDGNRIWLATLNGVNIISRKDRSLIKNYNTNIGFPHNSINQIMLEESGNAYVATESDRLYRIDPVSGISSSDGVMYGTVLNKMLGITRDKKGNLWVATFGNGVFQFSGDSVKSLTTANGLLSNYAYSILADNKNNIWIGHERGISRYNPESGLTKVFGTDFAKGGMCNMNGMYESPDGKIFIGTTEGLVVYDRSKDRKEGSAPVNNINSITINGVPYPYQRSFSLPYRKRYTIRINFTGIDFADPEKVYYSTKLDNFDDSWTKESPSREVTYNLRDGKYTFNLVSVNEDGMSEEKPLSFDITIKRPVWRTWWFILAMLALATGIVILIIREREKNQKKIQEYLEKELEARTRVVMKQKAEIELQNVEITDSINYARRIQSSILPDINRLKNHFDDAFIMLYPRDIVSGDFYWFDKLDDDRFILVCADSTGHGVPGAFMSMIGSTLLQDIVSRQRISKPSEILTMLDKQIFATLNQNLEVGVSNDGMDVVVCEFTMKNRHIRFASAMRPVILYMGGETYYIKGNRASVGGQTILEKYFDDQEYYLNEGDTIYMFSDGLPDQFGGTEGKKMKISRLKNLISEVAQMPIARQEEVFTKFYKEWKGNYEQVDDILFMGVKI